MDRMEKDCRRQSNVFGAFRIQWCSCYELGIKRWFLGVFREVESVYIGETNNEKKRITRYATDGSHLSEIITQHLNDGYMLYYRAQAKKSKREAKKMQDIQLRKYNYDWNVQLNIEGIDD